jgi:alkylhydroperoxidase/carboxymuconolactone decarboxylase family protein YurZ
MAKRRRVLGNEWVDRAYAIQRDEFRLYARAAIKESGFDEATIKEIILQQANCCGVPAANHDFKETAEVVTGFTRSK